MPVYRSLPITISGSQVLFADSVSAAAPSISFSADPNTGIYRVGGDRLGFATGGAGRVFIDELGWLFVGNAISSPSPATGNISGTLGSGTNIAGGDLRINGGQSTGSGAGGSVIFRTTAAGASGSSSNGATERMRITSDGTIVFGNGLTAASPTNTEIRATAGSGTDIAGANLTISGGRSTGSAAGGAVIFRTTGSGASGSAENSITERMRITSDGEVGIGSSTATGNRLALTYTTASGVAKIGPNSTGGNTSLAFGTSASGTYADRMTITSGGTIYFGNGEFSATPAASTLRGTNGQGTDIAGAELVIQAGAGTGNAASGAITFRTATAGTSGTGTNSSSDRMRVKTNGQVRFVPLTADPAGAEAGDVYYNSSTNKLKVYNGTAWVDLH